jgi:hypothetical protein
MMPRSMAKLADIEKKQKALTNLRTTTHWAHRTKLFSKLPRTYGKELPPITNLDLIVPLI